MGTLICPFLTGKLGLVFLGLGCPDKYSKNSLIRNPVLEINLFCFFTRVLFPRTA